MTSQRRLEANRRNALKSTGPKTTEGKAAVRLNALKHGLLSRDILLPGEDEAALGELRERLRAELQPVGELENLLVDRITAACWSLRRLGRVEAGISGWELYQELAERAQREARDYESSAVAEMIAMSTEITDEKKHEQALSKAEEERKRGCGDQRQAPGPRAGARAHLSGPFAFTLLSKR